MNTSRRTLLRNTALCMPLLALTACPAGSTTTPASIISTAQTVVSGLANALHQIAAAYPALIPAATLTQITGYLTLAQAAAAGLGSNLPAASGASTVQTVEGYINAVLATLAAPPINGLIPAPFNMAVAAASIVLPSLEAFVNQYLPATVAASGAAMNARAKFAATAPTLDVNGALAVLRGYAGT